MCTSFLGRKLPGRVRPGNVHFQYIYDMPGHAVNVRFGRKKTFPADVPYDWVAAEPEVSNRQYVGVGVCLTTTAKHSYLIHALN